MHSTWKTNMADPWKQLGSWSLHGHYILEVKLTGGQGYWRSTFCVGSLRVDATPDHCMQSDPLVRLDILLIRLTIKELWPGKVWVFKILMAGLDFRATNLCEAVNGLIWWVPSHRQATGLSKCSPLVSPTVGPLPSMAIQSRVLVTWVATGNSS